MRDHYYVYVGHHLLRIDELPLIDRLLFTHHGWRFVVSDENGKPISVHSRPSEAQRYISESEIERRAA